MKTMLEEKALIGFQGRVLEALAFGGEGAQIFDQICLLAEETIPGSNSCILLADEDGLLRVHSVPGRNPEAARLPEECEISLHESAFPTDRAGLWSMPVYAEGGKAAGAFVLTVEPRPVGPFEKRLMETAASVIAIVVDRENRAKALRNSEEKFRILFEEAVDCKMLLSGDGTILDINRTGHERLGYTRDEMVGRLASDFVTPENAGKVAGRLQHVKQMGHATYESAQIRKDGKVMEVEISTTAIRLDGRETFYSILRDISYRKKVEKALHESERRFRDLVETTTDWIWETDSEGRYTYISPKVRDLLGYEPSELLGKKPFDLMRKEEAEKAKARFEALVNLRAPIEQMESARLHKNGNTVIVETSGLPLIDKMGDLVGYRGMTRDITVKKEMEQSLRKNEARLRNILQNAPIGLAIVSLEGRFMEVNQSLCNIVGYDKGELEKLTFQEITHPDDLDPDLDHANRLLSGEMDSYQMEKRYIKKNGDAVWIQLTGSLLRDPDGAPLHFIAQIEDISARKDAQKQMHFLAYHDPVTGLPNRLFLVERLEWALVQAKRHGRALAVMFLDLDRFKLVNDTMGHDIGDKLLKMVASRLLSSVRKGDVVSRQGGDEFIIVLPELSHPEDAALVAEKIIEAICTPFEIGSLQIRIGASIGISMLPADGKDDAWELMKKADRAMYGVKETGRNGYRFFDQLFSISSSQAALSKA